MERLSERHSLRLDELGLDELGLDELGLDKLGLGGPGSALLDQIVLEDRHLELE